MKRFATLAVLAAGLSAAPASAQQLMAWPLGTAPGVWHGFMPHEPLPFPQPRPNPRPQPGRYASGMLLSVAHCLSDFA